jgi:hypothetical protein
MGGFLVLECVGEDRIGRLVLGKCGTGHVCVEFCLYPNSYQSVVQCLYLYYIQCRYKRRQC